MTTKPKVLFLCTGNSCRSQMAEGWARALRGDVLDAYSAGIEKHGLNPNAVRVMAEAGVDIRGHESQTVDELPVREFDYVVTVCGHANENCPFFPGPAKKVHVGFDDPPKLAAAAKTEEEALGHYRRVRDEIRAFVETLPEALSRSTESGNESIIESSARADSDALVKRLEQSVVRKECLTCDCFQGFLTQLEMDRPEAAEALARLKIPSSRMHGCLGCDPCPPSALFTEYLRSGKR